MFTNIKADIFKTPLPPIDSKPKSILIYSGLQRSRSKNSSTFSGALAPWRNFAMCKRPTVAFSYIGSANARHSSSRRQPNFAGWYKECNYGTLAEGATCIRLGGHHVGLRIMCSQFRQKRFKISNCLLSNNSSISCNPTKHRKSFTDSTYRQLC